MARKRTTRREKHQGTYYYDKATRQHQWTLRYKGETYRVKDRDEEKARSSFAELRGRVLSGVDVKGRDVLTKDFVTTYINTEVKGKQSTRDDYHKRADLYIFPTFGEMPIKSIARRHVVAWVNWMVNEPKDDGVYWAFSSIHHPLRDIPAVSIDRHADVLRGVFPFARGVPPHALATRPTQPARKVARLVGRSTGRARRALRPRLAFD